MYESLFTIINSFVQIAIQHPYWEVMILHEHLYNKQDLHLNLSHNNCIELVLYDGMWQAITRTNELLFFQRAFYKLSVKFGKSFFLSKYNLLFLQQYIVVSLHG